MIEWLTAALVVITAAYAWLTHRLAIASERAVEASREQIESALRPHIVIRPYVRPNTPFLYLSICNVGASAALDLRLQLDRDFFQFGKNQPDKNLRAEVAFATSMSSFAPKQELHFGLGSGADIFAKGASSDITPTQFSITATYRYRTAVYEDVSLIDLRPYIGSEENRSPIVEELERLRKTVEKMGSALQKMAAAQQAVQGDGPASGGPAP